MTAQSSTSPSSSFADMLDQYMFEPPKEGQILVGEVLSVTSDALIMDVGGKRDAIVPASDLRQLDDEFLDSIQAGDQLPVYVTQSPTSRNFEVSVFKGLEHQDWIKADEMLESGEMIELTYTGYNKGGMIVQFGRIQGFVPRSHISDLLFIRDKRKLQARQATKVGEKALFKVIEVDSSRNRLLLSARSAQSERRQERLEEMQVGDELTGRVSGFADYGVFIDLGGDISGLVHISELDWNHVNHPRDVLDEGEEVTLKVLSVDIERERVGLSRKAMLPGPWSDISARYKEKDLAPGKVTSVVDFGAFVEIEPGIEGLVHQSEMHGSPNGLKPGDKVLTRILEIDTQQKRLGLSMSQVTQEEQVAFMTGEIEGSPSSNGTQAAAEAAVDAEIAEVEEEI